MNYDKDDTSKKSPVITLALLLFFGGTGIHRFYVGKYITGLIFLIVRLSPFFIKSGIVNLGIQLALGVAVIYDIYALYSECFTDSKGKLVSDKDKILIYDTDEERERILFLRKIDKIAITLLGIGVYAIYYIVTKFVF